MTNQMHAAIGLANDRFQYLGLVRNLGIASRAPLDSSTVSEEARGHTAKLAIPTGNHGSPRGAGAARSRHQYNGRTGPALTVIDAPTRVLDHRQILNRDWGLQLVDQADLRQGTSMDTRSL